MEIQNLNMIHESRPVKSNPEMPSPYSHAACPSLLLSTFVSSSGKVQVRQQ